MLGIFGPLTPLVTGGPNNSFGRHRPYSPTAPRHKLTQNSYIILFHFLKLFSKTVRKQINIFTKKYWTKKTEYHFVFVVSDWQRQQRALKCGGSRSCKTSRMASSLFSCCIYLSTFPLSVWDHLLPDLCPNALCLKSSGVGKICTSCHFMSAPLFLWWTPSSSSSSPAPPSAPSTDIFTLRLYQSS